MAIMYTYINIMIFNRYYTDNKNDFNLNIIFIIMVVRFYVPTIFFIYNFYISAIVFILI